MTRFRAGIFAAGLLALTLAAAAPRMAVTLAGQAGAAPKSETEWRFFGSDTGATRYSPANQITAANVRDLRVAWRWSARNFGPRPATQMQVSPLIVNGVMYTTAGVNRDVVALDAATGQTLWHWRPTGELTRWFDIIEPVARSSGRGVTYWTDGANDERIFVVMNSYMLVALDAKTGRQVESFGKNGVVDLMDNLRWKDRPGLSREGRVANTSPPAIVGNVLVASISMHTGAAPNLPGASINEQWPMNIPGDVVAYDTKTGKMLWRFNIIPSPGEQGEETWLTADYKVWEVPRGLNAWAKERPDLRESSNRYTGNAGFWAPVTADPELGMFYIPAESPTSDYYGGYRPGNNLYANSVIALNAKTGKRVWHFQMTHHDIWDYDPPTAPILADITVQGRPVKAVIQLTKQGFAFVFDRTNGKPVWPIEERRVPKSDTPGEWTSPTQPFPTKPPALDVQGVSENDLVDFTPEIKAEALRVAHQYRLGSLYTPSSLPNAADGTMGTLTAPSGGGAVNWPGGAVDPVDGVLYVGTQTSLFKAQLVEGNPGTGVLYHNPRGQSIGPPTTVFGLPLLKPPYGRITAIDLKTGDRLWMVPHGNTPDPIKKNPKLQGVEIPNTGTPTQGTGLLVTSTLLFGGEGGAAPVLRAWDKKTGAVVAEIQLPGPTTGFPVTYTKAGRQYIAVAARVGDAVEIVALAIPTAAPPSGRQRQ
ncbi:MAG TPA: PQQ-binding-like beta-propeller repeat protein [Vicinamibacterales bacterium]